MGEIITFPKVNQKGKPFKPDPRFVLSEMQAKIEKLVEFSDQLIEENKDLKLRMEKMEKRLIVLALKVLPGGKLD